MSEIPCIMKKENTEDMLEQYMIPKHSQIPNCADQLVVVRPRSMLIRMNTCYICGKTYESETICPISSLNIFIGQSVAYSTFKSPIIKY